MLPCTSCSCTVLVQFGLSCRSRRAGRPLKARALQRAGTVRHNKPSTKPGQHATHVFPAQIQNLHRHSGPSFYQADIKHGKRAGGSFCVSLAIKISFEGTYQPCVRHMRCAWLYKNSVPPHRPILPLLLLARRPRDASAGQTYTLSGHLFRPMAHSGVTGNTAHPSRCYLCPCLSWQTAVETHAESPARGAPGMLMPNL